MERLRFWMVLVDDTKSISKKHLSLEDAKQEAERLLSLPENASRGVTILAAVAYGGRKAQPIEWVADFYHLQDYIPPV